MTNGGRKLRSKKHNRGLLGCDTDSRNIMRVNNFATLVARPVEEWYGAAEVPCDLIKPDPDNLRQDFDEDDLIDLGKNIASRAVGEITVFPILSGRSAWAGYFDLHDGERRWRASKLVKDPRK